MAGQLLHVLFFYKAYVEKPAHDYRTGKWQHRRRRLQCSQGAQEPCAGDHQAMQDMYAMRVNGGQFELVGRVKAEAGDRPGE